MKIRQADQKKDFDKSGLIRNLLIKDGDAEIFSEFHQPPSCEASLKRLLCSLTANSKLAMAYTALAASSLLHHARVDKIAMKKFEASCQLGDEPQNGVFINRRGSAKNISLLFGIFGPQFAITFLMAH